MSNYAVDRKKWAAMTIFEQMGNIYAEVGRTFLAKKAGETDKSEAAMVRSLDLFDATAEANSKSPKLKEILRAREIFADEYQRLTATTLENYLLQFALAARLQK